MRVRLPQRAVGSVTDSPSIRAVQGAAWRNKLDKGFNTTDVPLEFCYLHAEVAEAFDAWRRGRPDLGDELADIALFLVSLAEMNGIDLQTAVQRKLAKNASRTYVIGAAGLPVRVNDYTTSNSCPPYDDEVGQQATPFQEPR